MLRLSSVWSYHRNDDFDIDDDFDDEQIAKNMFPELPHSFPGCSILETYFPQIKYGHLKTGHGWTYGGYSSSQTVNQVQNDDDDDDEIKGNHVEQNYLMVTAVMM